MLERLVSLLQYYKHSRFQIRQPNGDSLYLDSSSNSNLSSFSAMAVRQNAEIFRQQLSSAKAVVDGVTELYLLSR
jgi:hypothetical protein